MLICIKVTGETFSFHHKRKVDEEARCHKHPNFQAKGLLPDRTLESFIPRSIDEAIPDFPGRIFQAKGQSKRIIILLSYSVLLFMIVENYFININLYLRRMQQ